VDPIAQVARVQIAADPAALARIAADLFVAAARRAVDDKGRFTVALSGGSTPGALYSLLATETTLRAQVPWRQVHFFFGDERHVGPDHPDSNYRTAHEAMLGPMAIGPDQVSRMKGEYPLAAAAAAEYEDGLRRFFQLSSTAFPRFDLILLGMGPDGHTASLFPGTRALLQENQLVVANWVGKFYTERITMTAPVLNNAASVLFMAHGEDKAQVLKAVLEGPHEPMQLPSQLIRPRSGALVWLVDQAAASLLDHR
jgi:6-phosphogluconolactonase